MKKILENLAATAEVTGQQITPTALAMMAQDLSEYPGEIVLQALSMLRKASKFRMTLAAIIEQIDKLQPDGRPDSDEAWAMIPRDEWSSRVLTEEMLEASGISQALLNEGDQVGARMAFKSAYERIVEKNKLLKLKPKWVVSLGFANIGRASAVAEAVRLKRITAHYGISLLRPDDIAPMLEMAGEGESALALEYKPSGEKAIANLTRIKELIAKKP